MDMNQIYDSKFLKASDLAGKEYQVTITKVDVQNMDDGKRKLCVYLNNRPKGVLLNKTNANMISKLYGSETNGWINKQIVVAPAWVDFKGEQVEAIRFRPPRMAQNGGGAFDDSPSVTTQASAKPPLDQMAADDFADREIPF